MMHRLLRWSGCYKRAMSTSSSGVRDTKILLNWLDLRGTGLSMLERLCLEEALLRHTNHNWMIIGTHEPWPNKFLSNNIPSSTVPSYIREPNTDCMVVMGIGGKPDQLLNLEKIKQDQVLVCKRFSGGGTVVLDASSLWTTVIGRTEDFTHVPPYPKDIMEWSAKDIYGPTFEHLTKSALMKRHGQKTLVLDTKSCSTTENLGKVLELPGFGQDIPTFALRENDYVFGDLKMGGNAQSIVKDGWLHHTSFLWDYDSDNMDYLKLPNKRPAYRGDRSHEEFLVKLSTYFDNRNEFFTSIHQACQSSFEIEKVQLLQAMKVINESLGGMDAWWQVNRTRIVEDI